MIDWPTIRPVMLDLISDISGGLQTVWAEKRRPYVDPVNQQIVIVRVRTVETEATDERRFGNLNQPAPNPTLEDQIWGNRLVSFDVRVKAYDHADDRFAFNAAERIRTRLRWLSSQAVLRAAGVAVVRAQLAQDVPNTIEDDHHVSIAILDVMTRIGVCDADTDPSNLLHCIETVDNPVDNPGTVISP